MQNNGRSYPPSKEIYSTISQKMKEFNSDITSKHIYVLINENRNGFKNKIMEFFNIDRENVETSYNVSSTSIEIDTN